MPMKNPPHPGGVVLRQCIEPLGLSITDAAAALGVTRTTLSELVNGEFQEVILDTTISPEAVRRVLLCSGKVYYDLAKYREVNKITDVAIVRVEQLYPFPAKALGEALSKYPEKMSLFWVQEEARNMGAWGFLRMKYGERLLDQYPFRGVCRPESASPATGSFTSHNIEQQTILKQAFELE